MHPLDGRGPAPGTPREVLWWDRLVADDPAAARAREPIDGDTTADVVVVGAGTTGVWTAYYVLEADPSLDVLVVDAGPVGAGGSGRTTGATAASGASAGADGADVGWSTRRRHALNAQLRDAVVEVGGVLAAEEVDAGFRYGGCVALARTGPAVDRLAARAHAAAVRGEDTRLLDGVETARHVRADGVLAGLWSPDTAHLDPVRLLRGLARVIEERGGRVAEGTRVHRVVPGAAVTAQGIVRARRVVVTSGAATVPGAPGPTRVRRARLLATEPLPAPAWEEIGLAPGVVVVEDRHRPLELVRTRDDRLVAAGAPADLARLGDLLPSLHQHVVTHVWDAEQGVTADGEPALGADPEAGIAWGVGAGAGGPAVANLAGRVLAELVAGPGAVPADAPWVRRPAAPAGRAADAVEAAALAWSDHVEERRGRTSALAPLVGRQRRA